MCKYCINPDNTKYAGAQDNDNGRRNTFSDASGCGDTAIHKTAKRIAECHNTNPLHTSINNCWFRSEQRKKLWARGRGLEASKIMAKQIEGFVKQK